MAVPCAVCAVSMGTAERTVNSAGTAMNLHRDCAVREEMLRQSQIGDQSDINNINDDIARLAKRKAGTATIWP